MTEHPVVDAAALHRAADRIPVTPTPELKALAEQTAIFLDETAVIDETGAPVEFTGRQAVGYGVLIGYLAATEAS